ncbi:hypothetical protein [Vibrio phage vB_VaS_L1]|nr:hypothetical protein [Vibrio phage vB_VaS_L1]
MLDGTNQNLVVYKSGGHEFIHGLPIDNGDILAVFPCSASLKPLPENYFDEENNMDYEQMSDISIDRKIFSLMFGDNDKDMERLWKKNKFRPCSQPDVAWPIIVDNGISIDFWGDFWCADIQIGCEIAFEHEDKNPLRAAMICFLKMKDAEK